MNKDNTTDKMSELRDGELYQEITDICAENGGVTKPMVDKLEQLFTDTRKQHTTQLIDEILSELPKQPKQVDKTPKPELESVEEPMGGGMIGMTKHTVGTGHTYTEQQMEDAAFECAKPYLDQVTAILEKRSTELCRHIPVTGWFECPFVIKICEKCDKRLYSTDCNGAKSADFDSAIGKLKKQDYHKFCKPTKSAILEKKKGKKWVIDGSMPNRNTDGSLKHRPDFPTYNKKGIKR